MEPILVDNYFVHRFIGTIFGGIICMIKISILLIIRFGFKIIDERIIEIHEN